MAARDPYLPISRVGKWKQQVPRNKPPAWFTTRSDSLHQVQETWISNDLCHFCSKGHSSVKCQLYLKKTPLERYYVPRKAHVCSNCFSCYIPLIIANLAQLVVALVLMRGIRLHQGKIFWQNAPTLPHPTPEGGINKAFWHFGKK